MRRTLFFAMTVAALTAAGPAFAEESAFREAHALLDPSPQTRTQELSFWAEIPFEYGVGIGVGVRYAIPIIKNGFIPNLNNSFEIEFGGDVAYSPGLTVNYVGCSYNYSATLFDAAAEARWTFHLTPKFDVYGKLGLGLGYWSSGYNGSCAIAGDYSSGLRPVFFGGPGVIFHLNDKFTLRAEIGIQGLRGGFGIDF